MSFHPIQKKYMPKYELYRVRWIPAAKPGPSPPNGWPHPSRPVGRGVTSSGPSCRGAKSSSARSSRPRLARSRRASRWPGGRAAATSPRARTRTSTTRPRSSSAIANLRRANKRAHRRPPGPTRRCKPGTERTSTAPPSRKPSV